MRLILLWLLNAIALLAVAYLMIDRGGFFRISLLPTGKSRNSS